MENLVETLKTKLSVKYYELSEEENKVYDDYKAATKEDKGAVTKRGVLVLEKERQVRMAQQELDRLASLMEGVVREVTRDDHPAEVSKSVVREVQNYAHNSLVTWL